MKSLLPGLFAAYLLCTSCWAQNTFTVTGTPIPPALLEQNYGKMPKGIGGYDLSICNVTGSRQSVVSSEIYQALAQASTTTLQPVGRQIMLASILRNQNRSLLTILNAIISSGSGVLSVLGSSKLNIPAGAITAAALGSIAVQQLTNGLKPILPADKLEKFDNEVLQSALVLDSGSCVERTVFALTDKPKAKPAGMSFHVR